MSITHQHAAERLAALRCWVPSFSGIVSQPWTCTHCVQDGDGGGVVHHATAADGAATDVQACAHKDRAVLVPPHRHGAWSRCPLPPPIAMPRQAKGIAQRHTVGITPTAQQQQAVRARRRRRIHPAGGRGEGEGGDDISTWRSSKQAFQGALGTSQRIDIDTRGGTSGQTLDTSALSSARQQRTWRRASRRRR